jgi:hypothetical protein
MVVLEHLQPYGSFVFAIAILQPVGEWVVSSIMRSVFSAINSLVACCCMGICVIKHLTLETLIGRGTYGLEPALVACLA